MLGLGHVVWPVQAISVVGLGRIHREGLPLADRQVVLDAEFSQQGKLPSFAVVLVAKSDEDAGSPRRVPVPTGLDTLAASHLDRCCLRQDGLLIPDRLLGLPAAISWVHHQRHSGVQAASASQT